MLRYILFTFLVFIFYGCTLQKYNSINNDFVSTKKILTNDRCAQYSYILNEDNPVYGKIFLEYIKLNDNCTWNGLSRGYFVDLFIDSIKAKKYKLVERLDFKNIEISHYLINDEYYVSIVYEYNISSDTFLIDYKGLYTNELIKRYNPNYSNKYLNNKRLYEDYSKSLVRYNFIKNYFTSRRIVFEN